MMVLACADGVLGSIQSSAVQVPTPFPQFDKVLHFTMFAILAGLLWCSLKNPRRVWVWAAIALLGALDEYHQSFLPFRTCDIFDWLADASGAAVAVCLLYQLRKSGEGLPRTQEGASVPS
jgi:VanZ family protein